MRVIVPEDPKPLVVAQSMPNTQVSRGVSEDYIDFQATAYTGYGKTATGTRTAVGRTLGVDPKVIPLGSVVYVEFPKPYSHLSGKYVAEDTGGAVHGKILDVFWGSDELENSANKFGRRKVKVRIERR
jgi:3D (Asp-Asp-Asp) domain-containing protein